MRCALWKVATAAGWHLATQLSTHDAGGGTGTIAGWPLLAGNTP